VWLSAMGCSRLLQGVAGCQLQQAAAKSGSVPRVAAGCCKVWPGAKGCSKLLQGLDTKGCSRLLQCLTRCHGAAGCCKVWLGAKGCSRLLQGLTRSQGLVHAAANPGYVPRVAAGCWKVWRCQWLQQAAAGCGMCQGWQQAAARSDSVPRVAAGCCKVWLVVRGCSRLLQGLAGCQGLQQAAASSA
jgi:hypothetical protein